MKSKTAIGGTKAIGNPKINAKIAVAIEPQVALIEQIVTMLET